MANLTLQATVELIDRMTAPLQSMSSQADRLTQAFRQTNGEMRSLQNQQRLISAFHSQSAAVRQTQTEFSQAHARLATLRQQMQATANPSQTLVRNFQQAERTVERLNQRLQSQNQTLTQTRDRLQSLGMNTSNLAADEQRLAQAINRTNTELEQRRRRMEQVQQIQDRYQQQQQKLQNVRNTATAVAVGGAAAMSVPIKASIDFESSMSDVKKVVDFGDNPVIASKGLQQMSQDIINLSKAYPMAAKDIAAIVAAGGQSGIAKQELTAFATDAIKMGIAFDTTADQAGQSMAEMRTAFQMTQPEVVALADKINYLGNNTPAAASGIMNIVQRIGPLGKVGGFASGSIAALGATLKGMGVQEEVAATGIKNMMLAMTAGESATKSQKAAYADLGFNAMQVAKDMQKDAEGTTIKILESVSKLEKYEQASTLKTLFGSESLSAIAPLLTNLDALKKNLSLVADQTKYTGSMDAEYQARAATTANQLQIAKNNAEALAITMGNTLLPKINELAESFSKVASDMQQWASENPELAGMIMKIASGVIILAAGVAVLATVLLGILGPIAMLRTAFTTLGLSMAVNPIFIAIGLLAVAAFMIYQNWAPIKEFFMGLWNSIVAGAQSLWSWLTTTWNNIYTSVTTTASNMWLWLQTTFNTGIQALIGFILSFAPVTYFMNAFSAVWNYFSGLYNTFSSYGSNIINGLRDGIMSKVDAVVGSIQTAANRIKSAFTGLMGIHSPSRIFMGYGGHLMTGLANGINNNANLPLRATTALAGQISDQAPLGFDTRATVLPSRGMGGNSMAMGYASGSGITININGASDPQAVAREVERVLNQRDRNLQARNRSRLADID